MCCAVVLLSFVGPAFGRAVVGVAAAGDPGRRRGERSEAPPAEKGFVSLFVLCPLRYLLLVCR